LNCCIKGPLETATQYGPENLASSIWLWSQFGGFTKLGKTKGGIGNPPFENPPQFLSQCCDCHSALAMLSDRLKTRRFELGILDSLCKAFTDSSGNGCRD
jgi:hypothetical protein